MIDQPAPADAYPDDQLDESGIPNVPSDHAALAEFEDEFMPCGEGHCRCYCPTRAHACGCDCPRDEDGELLEE